MASIYKRKNANGTWVWRAVIRIKGHPSVCDHFERKEEADDWAANTAREIKLGQYQFDLHKKIYTFAQLVERYIQDGALEHHRSASDTLRHLNYWKARLDQYAIARLTPELLGKERRHLVNTSTLKGKQRSAATINRYMSSLGSILTYAVQHLKWIHENPARRIKKSAVLTLRRPGNRPSDAPTSSIAASMI